MYSTLQEINFLVQASSESIIGADNSFASMIWLLFCCVGMCLFFPVFLFFLINFIHTFTSVSNGKYVPDPFTKLWYRTILITPKGIAALFLGSISILVGVISIDFSIISTVGFFIFIIFGVIYIYSQLINLYLFFKGRLLGRDLVESRLNLNILNTGEPIRTFISLKLPLPLAFMVKMRLIVPRRLGGEVRSTNLSRKDDFVNFHATFSMSTRGKHEVGPIIIEYTDLLGFTAIQLVHNKKNHITVYPVVKKLRRIDWESASTKLGDENTVKRLINTDDFFELREYQRGDDVRKIHWKMSAKTDKLMIKLPEITSVTTGNFVLFIDNLKLGSFKSGRISEDIQGNDEVLDRAIEVGGAIIDFTLQNSKEVKVFYYISTNRVRKRTFFKTRREEWLNDLAAVEWQNKTKINKNMIFDILVEEAKNASGLFVITADLEPERYRHLYELQQKHNVGVNILYVEPTSFLKSENSQNTNRLLKFLEKVTMTTPYLEQFPFFDNLLFDKLKYKQIDKETYEKLKSKSNEVQSTLKTLFPSVKIFNKHDDYISILEKY